MTSYDDEKGHALQRQREHRLRDRVRPDRPATLQSDPWLLGAEALDHLDQLRRSLSRWSVADHLEPAAESIKKLAWGPEESPWEPEDPPAPDPVPVFDNTPRGSGQKGMHSRWHIKGGRPCNCHK